VIHKPAKKGKETVPVTGLVILDEEKYLTKIMEEINRIKRYRPTRPLRETYAIIQSLVDTNTYLRQQWLDLFNGIVEPKLIGLMENFSRDTTKLLKKYEIEKNKFDLFNRAMQKMTWGVKKNAYQLRSLPESFVEVWSKNIDMILTWWVPQNMVQLHEVSENTKEIQEIFFKPLQDFAAFASEYAEIFKGAIAPKTVKIIQAILLKLENYGIISFAKELPTNK
jgi:hypothetical protein